MQTLHINTSNVVANEILAFLENLSKKGKEIEIIDDKIFQFEKKGINTALLEEQKGEVFSSDELLKEFFCED
ncbi:MAG: hypothetical protein WC141_07900 [Arcobacteraceae bacterium]